MTLTEPFTYAAVHHLSDATLSINVHIVDLVDDVAIAYAYGGIIPSQELWAGYEAVERAPYKVAMLNYLYVSKPRRKKGLGDTALTAFVTLHVERARYGVTCTYPWTTRRR